MHAEEGVSLYYIAEVVHWAALAFMALVYAGRLIWLFSWKAGRDRQYATGRGSSGLAVPAYSLLNVAMPWGMESTRKGYTFYVSFVVFHLGVTAGIFLAFVSSLYRPLMEMQVVAMFFVATIGAAFLVSIGRIVRRFTLPHIRLISTPDDHFALFTLTVWFALGVAAQAHLAGWLVSQGWMIAYLFMTSFFLVYVPFSKISHYLYYPFTRFWIGKTLGHRGSMYVGS